MSRSPVLSILIPTLNEARWVEYCIRTVRASLQSGGIKGEIIVCDGGSRDATRECARRAGADEVVRSKQLGRPHQLNVGARTANGEIFGLLHADALVPPDWASDLVEAVREGHVGGWSQIEILAHTSRLGSLWGLPLITRGINARTRAFQTATGDQGLFVRRDVFESIGGVPEVPIMEGYLLATRLRRVGSVAVLREPLRISGRRWEANGLLRTTLLMYGVRAGFALGVEPKQLAELWRTWSGPEER